jgi:D-mannonate dehydratase
MTVPLDWPADVVDRLTEEARRNGLRISNVTSPPMEAAILAVADKWGPVVSAWKALSLLAGEAGSATLQEADLVEVIVDAGESRKNRLCAGI